MKPTTRRSSAALRKKQPVGVGVPPSRIGKLPNVNLTKKTIKKATDMFKSLNSSKKKLPSSKNIFGDVKYTPGDLTPHPNKKNLVGGKEFDLVLDQLCNLFVISESVVLKKEIKVLYENNIINIDETPSLENFDLIKKYLLESNKKPLDDQFIIFSLICLYIIKTSNFSNLSIKIKGNKNLIEVNKTQARLDMMNRSSLGDLYKINYIPQSIVESVSEMFADVQKILHQDLDKNIFELILKNLIVNNLNISAILTNITSSGDDVKRTMFLHELGSMKRIVEKGKLFYTTLDRFIGESISSLKKYNCDSD